MIVEDRFARSFAEDWIDAWNSHDIERVLAHHADDFEMVSPIVAEIMGEPSGRLVGKSKVRAYWEKALRLFPELRFELITVLSGVDSMMLYYRGARGRLAAEVLYLGPDGKVTSAYAYYSVGEEQAPDLVAPFHEPS